MYEKMTNGDLISREKAIWLYCRENCGWEPEKCPLKFEQDGTEECSVVRFLKELPSAEPEQKHGKWIVIMNEPNITFDECKCSKCGVIEYFNKGWKKFSFCPNCGAKMDMERE